MTTSSWATLWIGVTTGKARRCFSPSITPCYSLEVICLLLTLKLKYPKQVHLIRGNHEDPVINCTYGFKEECRMRLSEDVDDPQSCWRAFNLVSDKLSQPSSTFLIPLLSFSSTCPLAPL